MPKEHKYACLNIYIYIKVLAKVQTFCHHQFILFVVWFILKYCLKPNGSLGGTYKEKCESWSLWEIMIIYFTFTQSYVAC